MSTAATETRPAAWWRTSVMLRNALHLAALCSFAVAHQYFDPLGDPAEFFFIEHGATALDVVLFALILLLVPPALLLLVEALAGLVSRRLRDVLHVLFVGGLVGLIFWQAIDRPGAASTPKAVLLGALVFGVLAGLAYWHYPVVRTYVTFLAPAPLVVLVLFLVFSPIESMVFGGNGSSPKQVSTSGTPVVMLVLDELPEVSLMNGHGQIDAKHYPNFARLARGSTWYRNTDTVADFTQMAVPAILSSQRGRPDQEPIAAEHPNNLFTLLGASYRMDVSEFATDLCAKPACPVQTEPSLAHRLRSLLGNTLEDIPALPDVISRRVGHLLDPTATTSVPCDLGCSDPAANGPAEPEHQSVRRHMFTTEDVRFDRFLQSLRPSRGHTLNFLHLELPHRPWHYLPSGQKYYESTRQYLPPEAGYGRWPRGTAAIIGEKRHLLQTEYVDRLLGRLIDRLKQLGLYDRALIVIDPDHGSAFAPGVESRVISRRDLGQIAPIPLFVKAPRQKRGVASNAYIQTTDILPTIAHYLHARIPWKTEGRSATDVRGPRSLTLDRAQGGGHITVSQRRVAQLRDDADRRRQEIFQGGDPFRMAPYGRLVGRRVGQVSVSSGGALRGTVDDPGSYSSVDPTAPVVPANVSGDISGVPPRERSLAIAVNGRIVATSWSIVKDGDEYYTVVVPASAFRRGKNKVEVFAAVGPSSVRRLAATR